MGDNIKTDLSTIVCPDELEYSIADIFSLEHKIVEGSVFSLNKKCKNRISK